ncbi:hypothetical protein AWB76_04664 [Caballeronia temeraria]|uniref:Uncharacterized protein n=1 Tax=Caballeronia temeraria TaxID=1777137 RepID=A0A158BTX2_9BURK|nr:hypothetical protein AWB76_04664 [Caballeronia temeraria]
MCRRHMSASVLLEWLGYCGCCGAGISQVEALLYERIADGTHYMRRD